jgi:hypothetical protein
MFEPVTGEETELTNTVMFVLVVWVILLVLGAPFALMLTGMAFEGGHTLDAYLSLAAVWSYPPLVAIAVFYRRKKRSRSFGEHRLESPIRLAICAKRYNIAPPHKALNGKRPRPG